jgi:hypothetical protein
MPINPYRQYADVYDQIMPGKGGIYFNRHESWLEDGYMVMAFCPHCVAASLFFHHGSAEAARIVDSYRTGTPAHLVDNVFWLRVKHELKHMGTNEALHHILTKPASNGDRR